MRQRGSTRPTGCARPKPGCRSGGRCSNWRPQLQTALRRGELAIREARYPGPRAPRAASRAVAGRTRQEKRGTASATARPANVPPARRGSSPARFANSTPSHNCSPTRCAPIWVPTGSRHCSRCSPTNPRRSSAAALRCHVTIQPQRGRSQANAQSHQHIGPDGSPKPSAQKIVAWRYS